MKSPRANIPLKTKLAAALLTMKRPDDNGELVLIIPHEHAKLMSDEQIISLFHFDHYPIPHAHEGPDEAWNLEPRLIAEHRTKTAKIDVPMMAKVDRIVDVEANGRPPSRIQSRGFAPRKQQRSASRPIERART